MRTTIAAILLITTASAFAADAPRAPEPSKQIDAASFYAGRWYEVGRTPMDLTKGCVAGTTDYQMKNGSLYERDACRDKTPDGKEEIIGGPLKILNPGQNTKVHVTYHVVLGIIPVERDYWMVDHGDSWSIMVTPDLKTVSLFTRDPRPSPALVERLAKEVRGMGYSGELEYPAQFQPA